MTSRQRLLKVLRGEKPDRMPVTLHMFDHARFVTQVYPELDPLDYGAVNLKSVELARQLGADVFARMLYDAHDPISIFMGGLDVDQQTDSWEVRTEEIREGSTTILRSRIRTPGGTLSQDYSINELPDGQRMHACTRKPIRSPQDLEIAVRYEPPRKPSFRQWLQPRVDRLKAAVGEDGIVGIWTPSGPFNQASLIYDLTDLYTLYLTDPPFYERLLSFAMERVLDTTQAMKEAGADVLIVGGNVPGGFMGAETYERYVLPFEKRFIDFCQEGGTPAMYHNCGQIMTLLESYKKLGVACVEPFTPPPGGDADLEAARLRVDGAYVTVGGVDKLDLLLNGPVERIRREVERIARVLKPGGNHILQNADSLEYATPVEHVRAYVETAVESSG